MKLGRLLWLLIPWLLFAGIVAGWIGYWNYVAAETERRVAAFAFEQNGEGAHASYAQIVRHGFPVLLRLEIRGISYAPAQGGWRIATPRADLNVEMLNPQHVILQARAPIAVSRADGAVTNVSAQSLVASLRTENGALAVAGIEGDDVRLDDPQQASVLTLHKLVANVRPDPRKAGDYQLALEADNLTLPRPVRGFESLGLNVPMFHALVVVARGAALLQAAPGDPLGPWRNSGGQLRFDAAELQWGALHTTATGEGELDSQRRIQGRLVLPIADPAPILTAIANSPNISEDGRHALTLLAAGYVVSGHQVTLDVNAHDGALSIEGIPVRQLAPVY